MRKLLFTALAVFSAQSSALPPSDIQRIINQTDEQYSNCRGGVGGTDPETNPYCIKAKTLFETLEGLGWCYGHEGQYGYEKTWEPCKKQETHDNEMQVDFNAIALAMYSTYMSFGNGVAAISAEENKCWDSSKNSKSTALSCTVSAFIGALIEASYAREQRRIPAPVYLGENIRARIFANYKKSGLADTDAESAIKFAIDNVDKSLAGLMNAGMH